MDAISSARFTLSFYIYFLLSPQAKVAPEFVSTKLILQISSCSSEIAIHSRVFKLDLPLNLYYFFLVGNWVVSSLFYCLRKCGNAWKLFIYDGMQIPRKKKEICWLNTKSSMSIYYLLDFTIYFWFVNTNSVDMTCQLGTELVFADKKYFVKSNRYYIDFKDYIFPVLEFIVKFFSLKSNINL
jgi:hypothetical protein